MSISGVGGMSEHDSWRLADGENPAAQAIVEGAYDNACILSDHVREALEIRNRLGNGWRMPFGDAKDEYVGLSVDAPDGELSLMLDLPTLKGLPIDINDYDLGQVLIDLGRQLQIAGNARLIAKARATA